MKNKKMFLAAAVAAMTVAAAHRACAQSAAQPYEPEMVQVADGTFLMGCTSEQGDDCYGSEKPPHSVTVGGFKIGKYEVTQAQWLAVMGSWPDSSSAPSPFLGAGDDYPAYGVSWKDAQKFIAKLNQLTGKRYRLPTEAEWEYAARGGSGAPATKYSGSDAIGDVAWHSGNSGSKAHAVGAKVANELGIYDMSGNVWEWCSDWYGSYGSAAQSNPTGASAGATRVLRGGSWSPGDANCRVADRAHDSPGYRSSAVGFRLALP
ncbi:MAG: formylglycine-generating enzyme family protein [Prevotellaceae bacterium]|nr:formylglycine-generating enzyme family protein [Prevotellaceae bacterium]